VTFIKLVTLINVACISLKLAIFELWRLIKKIAASWFPVDLYTNGYPLSFFEDFSENGSQLKYFFHFSSSVTKQMI